MATLGFLETDTLYPELLPDYGSYGRMFARFFGRLDTDLRYRYYQARQGELPLHPDECDAFLITGSRAGVYDRLPWIGPLRSWIMDFHERGAKIIGICFGHQIIAHSLGGHAGKSPKGWGLGLHSTAIKSTLFECFSENCRWSEHDEAPQQLRLLYSHQDQVERLPACAELLAGSDFCPYAAFRIDRRIMSFQGHPEFTPAYLQRLLQRRIEVIGREKYEQAIASLALENDASAVGTLLLDFIYS